MCTSVETTTPSSYSWIATISTHINQSIDLYKPTLSRKKFHIFKIKAEAFWKNIPSSVHVFITTRTLYIRKFPVIFLRLELSETF